LIRKGQKIAVRGSTRLDPDVYEKPEEFDGARFLRMRDEPSKANLANLVITGTDALGFGHGLHACPGCFFAANELKIALIHLLLKYDLKPSDDFYPDIIKLGFDLRVNLKATLLIRGREAEIDLDALEP
jgi:cytochrome P450